MICFQCCDEMPIGGRVNLKTLKLPGVRGQDLLLLAQ